MSLNSTPTSERIHIAFFGKTNSGKSSLINAVTNQNIAIVSEIKGTTTDPVYKSMEILPLGPVTLIDTAGIDDESELGKLRVNKTKEILNKIDIAIIVTDAATGISKYDENLISIFNEKNIKYIIAYNKSDLIEIPKETKNNEIYVSALKNININELKELIAALYKEIPEKNNLIGDCIKQNDTVILVTPIDSAAPKGRLILPQQQVIRALLERNAITTVVKETELKEAIKLFNNKVKLVITDSQVFKRVNEETPNDILLTSFSILFAKYKGVLDIAVRGVKAINELKENDYVLISEGCTHHRQCDDIGTVKLPGWIKSYTNKNINYEFSSGTGFPSDLSKYKMIIHCGGCMLKEQDVLNRYKKAAEQNIPITNYGITIAYLNGILKRSIQIFPELYKIL